MRLRGRRAGAPELQRCMHMLIGRMLCTGTLSPLLGMGLRGDGVGNAAGSTHAEMGRSVVCVVALVIVCWVLMPC